MKTPERGWVITLDGPAASGKSTTARAVATQLGFVYLDTGALYRALTVLALKHGVVTSDPDALGRLARTAELHVRRDGMNQSVWAGEEDLTASLRTPEVDRNVSAVSAAPQVRIAMLDLQRGVRARPGLVAEGRDLGTVVFPDAHLKIYLVAEVEVRARRRALERRSAGQPADPLREQAELEARDAYDSGRDVAPLRRPEGAVVVDTSSLSIAEQVARVVNLFKQIAET